MSFPSHLKDILRDLDARPEHTSASLAEILDRPLTLDDVAPYVRFDPKNYVRSLVARGAHWEVRLLCWRPGQTTTLHGHGDAACAFRVVRGSAVESVLGKRDRVLVPGDVVREESGDYVHQVGNAADDALLSLHVYSPPLPVDAPAPREGRTVVIVGGGFAGVAVATHLLRRADRDLRILLVERGAQLARGVAYGVDSRVFRLNVPASKMSIDPDDPGDFVRWAGAEATPDAFLPRTTYGAYATARFGQALRESKGKLRVVRGEAARVDTDAVTLADGTRLPADVVVLATGIEPRIAAGGLPEDARIVDAWDECAVSSLPGARRLLILGAGLSALDVIAFLEAHGFDGDVTVLSRRGLLPRSHLSPLRKAAPLPAELTAELPKTLRALIAWGRRVVKEVTRRGEPWQVAIDAIRPHARALWQGLSPVDRARFVRSVRPYWEVLRHRAPADALALVARWKDKGRLEVVAGSIGTCRPDAGGLAVGIRTAREGLRAERYDAIVRCIGPALARAETDAPVLRSLVESGRAAADPAGLGILTGEDGHVLGPDGQADPTLFALGALRRASSWETTSVPDIAAHAALIAKRILP